MALTKAEKRNLDFKGRLEDAYLRIEEANAALARLETASKNHHGLVLQALTERVVKEGEMVLDMLKIIALTNAIH